MHGISDEGVHTPGAQKPAAMATQNEAAEPDKPGPGAVGSSGQGQADTPGDLEAIGRARMEKLSCGYFFVKKHIELVDS